MHVTCMERFLVSTVHRARYVRLGHQRLPSPGFLVVGGSPRGRSLALTAHSAALLPSQTTRPLSCLHRPLGRSLALTDHSAALLLPQPTRPLSCSHRPCGRSLALTAHSATLTLALTDHSATLARALTAHSADLLPSQLTRPLSCHSAARGH